jgi:hypothetical protein
LLSNASTFAESISLTSEEVVLLLAACSATWLIGMASSMGPPILPGFSLRVQLFSSNAYGANDRPVRSFRVITAPDVTIREFCEEASRIHRINYGE